MFLISYLAVIVGFCFALLITVICPTLAVTAFDHSSAWRTGKVAPVANRTIFFENRGHGAFVFDVPLFSSRSIYSDQIIPSGVSLKRIWHYRNEPSPTAEAYAKPSAKPLVTYAPLLAETVATVYPQPPPSSNANENYAVNSNYNGQPPSVSPSLATISANVQYEVLAAPAVPSAASAIPYPPGSEPSVSNPGNPPYNPQPPPVPAVTVAHQPLLASNEQPNPVAAYQSVTQPPIVQPNGVATTGSGNQELFYNGQQTEMATPQQPQAFYAGWQPITGEQQLAAIPKMASYGQVDRPQPEALIERTQYQPAAAAAVDSITRATSTENSNGAAEEEEHVIHEESREQGEYAVPTASMETVPTVTTTVQTPSKTVMHEIKSSPLSKAEARVTYAAPAVVSTAGPAAPTTVPLPPSIAPAESREPPGPNTTIIAPIPTSSPSPVPALNSSSAVTAIAIPLSTPPEQPIAVASTTAKNQFQAQEVLSTSQAPAQDAQTGVTNSEPLSVSTAAAYAAALTSLSTQAAPVASQAPTAQITHKPGGTSSVAPQSAIYNNGQQQTTIAASSTLIITTLNNTTTVVATTTDNAYAAGWEVSVVSETQATPSQFPPSFAPPYEFQATQYGQPPAEVQSSQSQATVAPTTGQRPYSPVQAASESSRAPDSYPNPNQNTATTILATQAPTQPTTQNSNTLLLQAYNANIIAAVATPATTLSVQKPQEYSGTQTNEVPPSTIATPSLQRMSLYNEKEYDGQPQNRVTSLPLVISGQSFVRPEAMKPAHEYGNSASTTNNTSTVMMFKTPPPSVQSRYFQAGFVQNEYNKQPVQQAKPPTQQQQAPQQQPGSGYGAAEPIQQAPPVVPAQGTSTQKPPRIVTPTTRSNPPINLTSITNLPSKVPPSIPNQSIHSQIPVEPQKYGNNQPQAQGYQSSSPSSSMKHYPESPEKQPTVKLSASANYDQAAHVNYPQPSNPSNNPNSNIPYYGPPSPPQAAYWQFGQYAIPNNAPSSASSGSSGYGKRK